MRKPAFTVLAAALLAASTIIPTAFMQAGNAKGDGGGTDGAGGERGGGGSGPDGTRDAAPPVVINEFLAAPRTLFHDEWIELFNCGNTTVDIGGWTLDDKAGGGSRPYTIPKATLMAPGGFLVFNGSTTRLSLGNDGDSVRLLDAAGDPVDSCSFDPVGYDVSIGRYPDGGPAWRSFETPTPGASNGAPAGPGAPATALVITQVLCAAYAGEDDEYVSVSNPSAGTSVRLDGWTIADGRSSVRFPPNATILPGATLFVTGNATEFLSDAGFLPDFETRGSRPDVPQAPATGRWPSLANEGGSVALEDPGGSIIDAFAWGKDQNGTGWTGPPAEAPLQGEVARRAIGPYGGWLDTNSSADWPSSRYVIVGRSDFPLASFDVEKVTAFVSPDCSFPILARELEAARNTVYLEVYQFESWPLAMELESACRRGLDIRVLMEGAPVGGILDQERAIAALLAGSGASVSFLSACPPDGTNDRYTYLHAKFCVIDNVTSMVASENWNPAGFPSDPAFGNRGWGVLVRSAGLASFLASVFLRDSNIRMRDVFPYSETSPWFGPPSAGFVPDPAAPSGNYTPVFQAADSGPGAHVTAVLSPDTSALVDASVLGLIGAASGTLDAELLSCALGWTSAGAKLPESYLDALVSDARRGVRVRVLLDGTYSDPSDFRMDNGDVLNYLQYTAEKEGLDLQARMARVPGILAIHNKGIVVDGKKALVSSINWDPTSVLENREAGLIIEDAGVASYFEEVFLHDWNASAARDPANGTVGPRHDGTTQGTTLRALRTIAILLPAVPVVAAVAFILRRGLSGRADYSPPRQG